MSVEAKRSFSQLSDTSAVQTSTTSKKAKPTPRKTAYTYWKQSIEGQSYGERTAKEMRVIWNSMSDEQKAPYDELAKRDLQRFREEKETLEALQENNNSGNKKKKSSSKVSKSAETSVASYYQDKDMLTLYMSPSIHTNEVPTESIVYGPLDTSTKKPESGFSNFSKSPKGWFSVLHKRIMLGHDMWNDVVLLIPRKKVLVSVQKHPELFKYPNGVWFACNPTCPLCQAPAETFLVENALNDWLVKEAKLDLKKTTIDMDTNRGAQYDEDHSVMRFCCYGHITFDFCFQLPQDQPDFDYPLPLLPGYSNATSSTNYHPYNNYF